MRSQSQPQGGKLSSPRAGDKARKEAPEPAGLGVLFCGTLEKRHPITGAVYPRFVVLTASALHWFRRPEKSELFGEPRGVVSLATLRKASIVGNERREVCFEFDPKSPLGAIYQDGIQRVQSNEAIRASSASSARVFGTKRTFVCPTTASAIAWRAAIDLAKGAFQEDLGSVFNDDDACVSPTSLPKSFACPSKTFPLPTAKFSAKNPSSLAEYLTEDVAAEMDGYGDAQFLEALGHLVETDDEYALPPNPPRSPNQTVSPSLSIEGRRKFRERSEIRYASVIAFHGHVIATNVLLGEDENFDDVLTTNHFTLFVDDDDAQLLIVLCDGTVASTRGQDLHGDLDLDLHDPRFQGIHSLKEHMDRIRRTLSIRVTTEKVHPEAWFSSLTLGISVGLLAMAFAWADGLTLAALFCAGLAGALVTKHPAVSSKKRRLRIDLVGEQSASSSSVMEEERDDVDDGDFAKFLAVAKDEMEAAKRWRLSRAWRRREHVDDVLREPQPFFDVIKDAYPHWLGGRSRKGELVYWECVGRVDAEKLRKAGVTLDALIRHYIFLNEWTWKVLSPAAKGSESYQVVILDVADMRLQHVGGLRLEYLRACADIAQLNYPDRTSRYVVINAPAWMPVVWRVVEPLLNAENRSKITLCRPGKPTRDCLLDLIDPKYVPASYGGDVASDIDKARRNTPEERSCKAFVDSLGGVPSS